METPCERRSNASAESIAPIKDNDSTAAETSSRGAGDKNNKRPLKGKTSPRQVVHKAQKVRSQKRADKNKAAVNTSLLETVSELQGRLDCRKEVTEELTGLKLENTMLSQALTRVKADLQTRKQEEDIAIRKKISNMKLRFGSGISLKWDRLFVSWILFIVSLALTTTLYQGATGFLDELLWSAPRALLIIPVLLIADTAMCYISQLTLRVRGSHERFSHIVARKPYFSESSQYTYEFVCFDKDPHLDLRSDLLSIQELKHADALYATVLQMRWYGPMVVDSVPLKVSMELLSHISTAGVLATNADPEIAFERICFASKNFSTVNINRYKALEGDLIVNDTQIVAFAMWKDYVERRDMCPFPRKPATLSQMAVATPTGTVIGKFLSQSCLLLSLVLLLAGHAVFWILIQGQ